MGLALVGLALAGRLQDVAPALGVGSGGVARVGATAPDFSLPTLEGGTARLSSQRGRVVVLNYWATWCEPCRTEMPALQAIASDLADRPFTLWAIDYQEDLPAVAAYREKLELRLTLLLDADGATARRFGVRGLPATFLLDRSGVVREARLGQLLAGDAQTAWTPDWLAARIRALLAA